MNVFARFIGIITSPRPTFQDVVKSPRVLGMLLLVCGLSAVTLGGFFATQTGKDAWMEAATSGPMAPSTLTDQQYAAIEKMSAYAGPMAMGQALIGTPIMMAIVAVILWAIFNAALGGGATYKQLFALVVHSWVILTVSQVFTLPLMYASGSMNTGTNLGVLLPMLEEGSFLARFLGSIDLFLTWSIVVLAIGLAVLFRRRTQPIAMTLIGLYVVIAGIVAAVRS